MGSTLRIWSRRAVGLGLVIVGSKLVVDGFTTWRNASSGLGEMTGVADLVRVAGTSATEKSQGAPRGAMADVRTIDERVAIIRRLIRQGGTNPQIHEVASEVLARKCGDKWCTREKDWEAEVKALYAYVRSQIRYTKDMLRADTFTAPTRTLRKHGGDCDDYVSTLGALLESVGHPVRIVVMQVKGEPTWSHISIESGLPPGDPKRWIHLDASVADVQPGWAAPGLQESLRTSRAAGAIVKAKIYEV